VFLAYRFNYLRKMQKLVKFFAIQEIRKALTPAVFKLDEDLDKFYVIFKLRVDYFDVLLIFSEKVFKVLESLFYPFCQTAHRFWLSWADSSEYSFSSEQNFTS